MSERRAKNLMRPSQYIDNVMYVQAKEEKEKNRLRLKTSIVTIRCLALQGCAFRGNDESLSSSNHGNFLELVKAFAKMSMEINEVVLENAPKNTQYIAPEIQKDILHIMANRVRQMVREEVGDKFFCILVDEARDISKREQMAIILRGQGYDGASNMRGAWNGLQALFLRDCPYAYYVHYFAHRLQLTLVSVAKDVSVIWEFFSHLDNIVNIVTSSIKRIAKLHTAQRNEIEHMLAIGERDSGSGVNQIGNLQRAGATRWSSHYNLVKSLIGMYAATCKVFEVLSDYSPNGRAKAKVRGIYRNMASFEFVFILHLMHKIMRTTDTLC
ncbi:zinc finger MYM-type protein 1-like [Zingiber officinale]|uniref:zinc finger MYM-type protein 1-like n=1 Tax=Zingiber officinale TaxID=94328 RepID=UPI001C4BFF1C|nr:zinc finger MYM-type protein 1-like [Zingiber officinale]